MTKITIAQQDLKKKVSLPRTLSVLKAMAGTQALQEKLKNATAQEANEVLKSLDEKSRAYTFLSDELMEQVEQQEKPRKTEKVELALPGMEDVTEGLEALNTSINNIRIPEPLSNITVDNFPEQLPYPKFPAFPTSLKISNLPKPVQFPKSFEISNLPEFDTSPIVEAISGNNDLLLKGLSDLSISLKDSDEPLKVHIVNSSGKIIEDFTSVVKSGGMSSSSGGSTSYTPRNIKSGNTIVTTSGTAVILVNDGQTAKKIDMVALKSNTSTIYIGANNVSAASEIGISLEPGDVYAVDFTSPEQIYIDALVSGEGISYNISS